MASQAVPTYKAGAAAFVSLSSTENDTPAGLLPKVHANVPSGVPVIWGL
jgi:hypothetical protein